MKLSDLNEDQVSELKQRIVFERAEKEGRTPSYAELADAAKSVDERELEDEFGCTEFVSGDFVGCSREIDVLYDWIVKNITVGAYEAFHDKLEINCDIQHGLSWARSQILKRIEDMRNTGPTK